MKRFFALFLACVFSLTMLTALSEGTTAPADTTASPAETTAVPAETTAAPGDTTPAPTEAAPTEEPLDMNALYIIPDSDTRRLTEKELWQYELETLDYIRNEIQARHGYAFVNEDYFAYFNAKPWYTAGGFITKGSSLSDIERANIRTINEVAALMQERGTTNSTGIDIDDIIEAQNALGGYGNQNDGGNGKGNGQGKLFVTAPESQKKENESEDATV